MLQVLSSRFVPFAPTRNLSSRLSQLRVLRLSVTDRCNFRCRYCMPREGVPQCRHDDLLSLEKLAKHVQWIIRHTGINKIRLTGGEPRVRKGIGSLIADLAGIPTVREITLTTNGSLLPQMASDLKAAGLRRVNISLDSLNQERFALVTRGGRLDRTLAGIRAAQEAGLTPIKINTVLHRSTWKQEVPALLDFAAEHQLEIRFIELMRTGTEREWCESEFVSVDEVCAQLDAHVMPLPRGENERAPAQRMLMTWRGAHLKVGWISPRSHPFCHSCERLRMDAKGSLRRCLMDSTTFELPRLLGEMGGDAVANAFECYIDRKLAPVAMDSLTAMSQIGG